MPLSPPPIFPVTANRDRQVTKWLGPTRISPPRCVGVTFSQGFDVRHTLGPQSSHRQLQAPTCSLHHPLVRTGKAEMKYIADYPCRRGIIDPPVWTIWARGYRYPATKLQVRDGSSNQWSGPLARSRSWNSLLGHMFRLRTCNSITTSKKRLPDL